MLQITECTDGSSKSALFTWINFTHCRLKFATFGNLCIECPVLFELLQNWTTQRFTVVFYTKPGTHIRSTGDVTGNMAQFKMADFSNLEELLRGENGLCRKKKKN